MKRCPQCTTEYYDDMLEFCLEDGAKLNTVFKPKSDASPLTKPNKPDLLTEKFSALPTANDDLTVESVKVRTAQKTWQEHPRVKEKLAFGYRVLEVSPLVVALSHNWWQWLYAANQSYSSVSAFLISPNFLIWLLLLIAGAGLGLLAVRRCENKGFALFGLVMMAVNLILFIVPKR